MNIEQARHNMIVQQIRPWEVLDQSVLDLLEVVKREDFVPAAYRAMAFVDMEIPLLANGKDTGEAMLSPKVEARLLQELDVKRHETALEIGAGSGYMAALLAHKAMRVVTVEIVPELRLLAADNLARSGTRNVEVELGDGSRGWPAAGQVDVLVLSGSVPIVPEDVLRQLKIGGRLAAFVGDAPVMSAQIITRVSDSAWETMKLFETVVKPLRNALQPTRFKF